MALAGQLIFETVEDLLSFLSCLFSSGLMQISRGESLFSFWQSLCAVKQKFQLGIQSTLGNRMVWQLLNQNNSHQATLLARLMNRNY